MTWSSQISNLWGINQLFQKKAKTKEKIRRRKIKLDRARSKTRINNGDGMRDLKCRESDPARDGVFITQPVSKVFY